MNHRFKQLGGIIENILRQSGLEKGVKESQAINYWQDVAGKEISGYTKPIKVADGKLFIKVSALPDLFAEKEMSKCQGVYIQ